MPNHVKNLLTADKPEAIDVLMGEDGVDFGKIIEPPDYIVQGSAPLHVKYLAELVMGQIDLATVVEFLVKGELAQDFTDEHFEIFIKYLRAFRASPDGLMDWYDWNIQNWGTKWNGYSAERMSDCVVEFETAWSPPHPVIESLAMQTGVSLLHEWSDEDTGNNVGWRKYQGDGWTGEELSGTKEGFELAFKLRPYRRESYVLDGDTYRYKEE